MSLRTPAITAGAAIVVALLLLSPRTAESTPVCSVCYSGISCCADGAYEAGEVWVIFIDGTTRARAEEIAALVGATLSSFYSTPLSVSGTMGVPFGRETEYLTRFGGFGEVESVQLNDLICFGGDPPCPCCPPDRICPGLPRCAGEVFAWPGTGSLALDRMPSGDLALSWGASCMSTDSDYEVYEGAIGDFTSHTPMTCSTGGAEAAIVTPGGTDTYYLVVPRNSALEGSYGTNSHAGERRPGAAPCLPQAIMPACSPSPPCGDGVQQGFEQCDGADLGGRTCADAGFHEGTLACGPSCSFDTSGCIGTCGDQVRGGHEDCDGSDLGGQDCLSQGFDAGTLACGAGCSFDYTGCTTVCGDGIQRGLEKCDGADLGGRICEDWGLPGGTLSCNGYCLYDLSSCAGVCGDGMRTGDEVCDGIDVGSGGCAGQGFDSGVLACNATCDAFDTTGCWTCGNNVREAFETCDGTDLAGQTCVSQGHPAGTLSCNSSCNGFDYSLCIGL